MSKPLKPDREARLNERCGILAKVVLALQPVYRSEGISANQKQLIETMIGAAIWYLPQLGIHWTGEISLEALRSFHPKSGQPKPKLTQDHCYPRKLAAFHLLTENWEKEANPGAALRALYDKSFGRFNYLSPGENRRLMPFQRSESFKGTNGSYRRAKIELIKISREDLKSIRCRDGKLISSLLKTHHASKTIKSKGR